MTDTGTEMDIDAYRALVGAFHDRGYAFVGFDAAEEDARHVIARHDVDFSIDLATTLAETEAALGIAATYFVMLTNPFYNLVTREGRAALQRIIALGHAVELHFDVSCYAPDALEEAAGAECGLLSDLTGRAVNLISFHRPAPEWLDNPATLAGRSHTYMPRYFSRIGYCSDSRGAWRFGHPMDHEAAAAGKALQLLTHPIWWTTPAGTSVEKIDLWRAQRHEAETVQVGDNCIPYRDRPVDAR
ncbi:hypothetical protein EOI86_16415 [Hwanghaeella grinnelliae]|uniref:Uncharacterized protein n=1 Tax=Hwanghaeella grinnelliae TaxID=2500179 RepID=A0A3S2VQQ0_9PROT|nr:hypothetical protein [Hwanghaeella grinnelliae]RVU36748.1 hypothetical protein EOI86_16415 [Hwanghaeella grinnelliae]